MSCTPYITSGWGHCPICGQQTIGGQFLCGHTPGIFSVVPTANEAAEDPRDATIRELRALCGEAAAQLDEYLDYERTEHICIVIGDEALAAKLRAASEGKL